MCSLLAEILTLLLQKLRNAAAKTGATIVADVIHLEMNDPALAKLIKKETGDGSNSGTVALLWMKRTMQFIAGLLRVLIDDASASLSSASRQSYAKSLKLCHNFFMRSAFDAGLRFAPTRETFYTNLTGDSDVQKVESAMRDFVAVFQPQVEAFAAFYLEQNLEPYIKA